MEDATTPKVVVAVATTVAQTQTRLLALIAGPTAPVLITAMDATLLPLATRKRPALTTCRVVALMVATGSTDRSGQQIN